MRAEKNSMPSRCILAFAYWPINKNKSSGSRGGPARFTALKYSSSGRCEFVRDKSSSPPASIDPTKALPRSRTNNQRMELFMTGLPFFSLPAHRQLNTGFIVIIIVIVTCKTETTRVLCFYGEVIPTKELPGCPGAGHHRRTLDDPTVAGLVSAGTTKISGFSGVSGRRCSKYAFRPLEGHGRAGLDHPSGLQRPSPET